VLSQHHHSKEPVVKTRLSPWGEGFQVAIYTPDQRDLFGQICGYFAGAGLSVLDAKIHTTGAGYALDTFLVVDPFVDAGAPEQYRNRLSLVETELARQLATENSPKAVVEGRSSRRSRSFPVQPSVDFRPDESHKKFVLSIVANDRPGLLYQIAQILADYDIAVHAARVTTLGERVEDSFLVDGPALLNNRTQLEIENKLLLALEQSGVKPELVS
jgi:[protein-PII] uridylyltransferase